MGWLATVEESLPTVLFGGGRKEKISRRHSVVKHAFLGIPFSRLSSSQILSGSFAWGPGVAENNQEDFVATKFQSSLGVVSNCRVILLEVSCFTVADAVACHLCEPSFQRLREAVRQKLGLRRPLRVCNEGRLGDAMSASTLICVSDSSYSMLCAVHTLHMPCFRSSHG